MTAARVITACLAAAALGLVAHNAAAAEPQATADVPAFRRIFVPEAQIKAGLWTQGHLPIDAAEFRRLTETVHARAIGSPGAGAAEIEVAEYTAALVDGDVLVGSAVLQLAQPASSAPTLERWLLLTPCSLAIADAKWDGAVAAAVLGTGPDGILRVKADSGRLHCKWSLRAQRSASGAIVFPIELPRAPTTRISIDAPSSVELVADRGIAVSSLGPAADTTHWMFELGGQNTFSLRAVTEGAARERRPLTLLRQSSTYEMSSRGVNLSTQLKLDIHSEALKRLSLDLDPDLRLVSARYGEQQIPFAVVRDAKTGASRVSLELPEPISGAGRVLQLSAMSPLVVDKRWRLPGLRVEGMSWQEGTATLLIPGGLLLEQLTTDGCRQSRIATLPAPARGESLEIQFFRPTASIDVLLVHPPEQLQVHSGAAVDVSQHEITSRTMLEVTAKRGSRRFLPVAVHSGWTIDAVEDLATNRPLDWEVDDRPDAEDTLSIHLADLVTPERGARLVVRGHRALPAESSFASRHLEMLGLAAWPEGLRRIAVRGAEGMELRWSDASELHRLDPLQLTPAEAQLFAQPPAGSLFALDAAFAQSAVAIERRKASYTAEIRIDASVHGGVLTETYTVHCAPETSRVDRLLVRFSETRESPLEWNLAGANSGQFSARRLSPGEQEQVGLPEGGEAWELSLQLARPGNFELRAVRSTPMSGDFAVALASVAEAQIQRGTVTIRALASAELTIKNERLIAIPAELLEGDRVQTTRGTFRYHPGRDDLGAEPAVTIAAAVPKQPTADAWVWNCRLASRYAVAGISAHFATLDIQTAGKQQLRVTLPANTKLQAAWVDTERLPLVLSASGKPGFVVDLPPGRALATLSLYYTGAGGLPTLVASRQPEYPTVDVPVMSRQWSIWLPPGYEVAESPSQFPIEGLPSPSVAQRLFGVLARGATTARFNPLAARDWEHLVVRDSQAQAAGETGSAFIVALGSIMSEHFAGEAESALDWGQLLTLASESQAQSGRTLLVDVDGLARLGLRPQTVVQFHPGDTASQRGIALVRSVRLTVLATANTVVLCNTTTAASSARDLAHASQQGVFTIEPGTLADELASATTGGRGPRFYPVTHWGQTPDLGPYPWKPAAPGNLTVDDVGAWNTYAMIVSPSEAPAVRVVHTSTMAALAWVMFLAGLAAGCCLWRRPAQWLLAAGSLAAIVALLLPAVFAPLPSAVFLAALVCLVLRAIRLPQRQSAPRAEPVHSSRARLAAATHAVWLLSLAAVLHGGAVLYASQPTPAPPTTSPANDPQSKAAAAGDTARRESDSNAPADVPRDARIATQRVLVPVDEAQQVVGQKYYVPESLFVELDRLAAGAGGKPRGWLINRCDYRGTIARNPVSKQLSVSRLRMQCDLQVLQGNTQVALRMRREGADNPVIAARLDDQPLSVSWNSAGDELTIGELAAGRYRLELDLQARMQTYGTTAGFDLPIIPSANATLEVSIPADAPMVELPRARGQVRADKDRARVHADLGACELLSVRWPLGLGMESTGANVEAEELIWVKVRPGTTQLDAKFKYRVIEGAVRQVRLLADPRLQLIPSTGGNSPIAAVRVIPGDPQRIDLELSRTVSDQVVLELSFLLTGTSGVGNLQFPRLETTGARTARRWLAASVDAALESKELPGEDSKPLAIADFMAAWGATDARPQAAYSIPRGEAMWVLATQPATPRTSAEQNLTLSFGRNTTLVDYEAALSIDGGYLFQLGVKVPPNLVVERISAVDADVERVARWSHDPSGQITIFLTGPITGRQKLTLRGQIDAPPQGAVPQLALGGAAISRNRWRLHRQSAVLVQVEPVDGVTPIDAPPTDWSDDFGALVGHYESTDPRANPAVKVTPNAPQASAVVATGQFRDNERWMAELFCDVKVAAGAVDAVEFDIPPQWVEPFRFDPPLRAKLVSIPGETRRQLTVYPDVPITDAFQLRIRGRVVPSAGDRLRVPDIVPRGFEKVDRYVALPQRLDLQQLGWETVGLTRAQLPSELSAWGRRMTSAAFYRASGESFQASPRRAENNGGTALVRLADIHVSGQPDGSYEAVASFDLEPPGAATCVLQFPPGSHVRHVSVDQLPTQFTALGGDRWQVSLGPPELPQRVVIIYAGASQGDRSGGVFEAPSILGMKTQETLWTVYDSTGKAANSRTAGVAQATAVQQELRRLSSVAALVELPGEILGEHLPEQIARWYQPWKERYSATRARLAWEQALEGPARTQTAETAEVAKLDAAMTQVDERLGATTVETRPELSHRSAAELLSLNRGPRRPTRFLARGAAPRLELVDTQPPGLNWASRITACLTIALVGLAAAVALRSRPYPRLPASAVLAALGVVWWWLLAPSVLGLVIVLLAVWMGVLEWGRPAPRVAVR